jgi:hypothetical protein
MELRRSDLFLAIGVCEATAGRPRGLERASLARPWIAGGHRAAHLILVSALFQEPVPLHAQERGTAISLPYP